MTADNFGPILRAAREAKGLTQQDIAKHLNYDHSYISKLESSKAPMPNLETLLKWSFFLGCKDVIANFVIEYPGQVAVTAQPKKVA